VIGWERRVLLRHYLEQGLTKTELAERFGITRQTIHRWIRDGELDQDLDAEAVRYGPRPPVPRKIDPYREIIRSRLAEYPRLTAKRLFDEIRAAGYPGGYTQVKEYVRSVRPKPPEEPVVRFETPPGHQAQVDFADFVLPWGRRFALLVVLGYSRLLWLRFFPRKTMGHLFDGLDEAFGYFGGVPRELLFDQMKAVVLSDRRSEGGRITENAEFLRFAHHWGFRVRACRPYRAQTKGKVERPVSYVRQSFFYGREFTSDSDLNAQARSWLDRVANPRIHGTLKERPVDRFEQERAQLGPLAARPYRSYVLAPQPKPPRRSRPTVPRVEVERRPLEAYARVAEAVR
jgi:transposase